MSEIPVKRRSLGDARLVLRQLHYEQLSFWRNPVGAIFTIGFSVLFLILLSAGNGSTLVQSLGGVREIQYYVAGFAAYGVMSACFNNLAISLVIRRETGLLKRLRLAPLPNWVMLGGIFANALTIACLQVVVLIAVGRLGYHLELPHNYAALVVALASGVACFCALGVAMSTIVPNQESGAPVVSIIFFVLLFLSGLWFPLTPGSGLYKISGYFPVHHLIIAAFAPFDLRPGVTGWDWSDLYSLWIWGAIGVVVALRRFKWEPRRT